MLHFIPSVVLIAVVLASWWRGRKIHGESGQHAWAFSAAKGRQRMVGLTFAVSVVMLAIASLTIRAGGSVDVLWVSAICAVLGGAIVMVAQIQMGAAWRIGVREGDAPLLVRRGLFRFSRNPIFVGMILIGLGIAIGAGLWWAWAAWLAFVAACHFQVKIEEAHLEVSFGQAYQDFARSVPRWVGLAH